MKKKILVAVATFITLSSNASEQSDTFKAVSSIHDTLEIKNAKAIKLDSTTVSFEWLQSVFSEIKLGKVVLIVDLQWMANAFNYFQTSKNGDFTGNNLDVLKAPLLPYIQYLYQLQQSQKSASLK